MKTRIERYLEQSFERIGCLWLQSVYEEIAHLRMISTDLCAVKYCQIHKDQRIFPIAQTTVSVYHHTRLRLSLTHHKSIGVFVR